MKREGVRAHGAPPADRLDLPFVAQQVLRHQRPVRADQVSDRPRRARRAHGSRRHGRPRPPPRGGPAARRAWRSTRATRCGCPAGGGATRGGRRPARVRPPRRADRPAHAAPRGAPNRRPARHRTAAAGAWCARRGSSLPSRRRSRTAARPCPAVAPRTRPASGPGDPSRPAHPRSAAPRRPTPTPGTSGSRIASWTASASARPAMMRPDHLPPGAREGPLQESQHAFRGCSAHHLRRCGRDGLQARPLGPGVG